MRRTTKQRESVFCIYSDYYNLSSSNREDLYRQSFFVFRGFFFRPVPACSFLVSIRPLARFANKRQARITNNKRILARFCALRFGFTPREFNLRRQRISPHIADVISTKASPVWNWKGTYNNSNRYSVDTKFSLKFTCLHLHT